MEPCIYHEDKTAFDSLRRHLQRIKVFPRHLSSRLAMATCSCRRKRSAFLEISDAEYRNMKEIITSRVCSMKNGGTEETHSASIHHLENILQNTNPNSSQKYLTYIIYKALEGNFDYLELEKGANTKILGGKEERKKTEEEENPNTEDKPHKMTMNQIQFMVRKRKRKMPVHFRLVLPIHGNNMYLVTRHTGRELKGVARRFRCYIEIDWASINDNIDAGIPISIFKVWCRTQDDLNAVKRYFNELMMTKDFIDHVIVSNEYKYLKEINNNWERTLKVNYCLTDHFTEKVLGRKKSKNRYLNSRQRVKTLPTALSSVLCERCCQSYRDVLVQDRPCYFHPGTIVDSVGGKTWSCCDAISEEAPLAEEHHCTGCWKGSHIWNLTPVLATPGGEERYLYCKPKQKLKWAVVGYAKAF